ncbi:hypothetical protein NPX13_g8219 [Xylaria arbuscula]|uniref:Xylanolytic transcriptional activator regulatory domain-containing protein n=1 Tax=Xylaria arbuscula TaxID=114810 RepID=A0A9W8N8U3_9PEZI|nr:hypothetical protein NPX13_g8219 [Xylaria arbuscula]
MDEASQMRLAEIKEKQGTLERQLERDVAKSTIPRGTLQQRILADEVEDGFEDEHDLEATPLVALDLTYEDDADGDADDMIDLGVQIGKMRITERIGGLSRPRLSEEILAGITQRTAGHQPPLPHGAQMPALEDIPDSMSESSLPDFLKPTNQHIVPTSGFLFGQIGEPPSLLQYLPYRHVADRLMTQYFRAVHPIAPCSHRPSIDAVYTTFWEEINAGFEPRPSMQAIVFATMFSGIVSMKEDVVYHDLGGYPKANWVASLKMGTETALSKANFLRTTRVETMQAFIIYMIPLCRAEVSRAHSVLVGAAVRMAECMGLHRDGETYGLTPLETHVRRLVWHQLCFLDIRTCEAQGPKPVIRREDYDTKLPMNCNEEDLPATAGAPPPAPSEAWTSNTLALIRFEINEMMRAVWVDRRRLETRPLRKEHHVSADVPAAYHGATPVLCQRVAPDATTPHPPAYHLGYNGDRALHPSRDQPSVPGLGVVHGCLLPVPGRHTTCYGSVFPSPDPRGRPHLVMPRLCLRIRPQAGPGN